VVRGTHPSDCCANLPHDDPLEPHANWRYVNYAAWQGMAEECDLVAWLTHPQTGLLHTSDLPRSLTEADYRVVNEAYLLRSVFNEGQPGWAFEPTEEDQLAIGELPMQPAYDEYYARLTWLRFWIRWALDHCENPVIMVNW
jgi:hypothetical protein